ncbi:MAG: Crp/Fnr family transcriptional regulator [Rhodospirillaceae bacterium]|nr:Crp/Fnr family transcriptional regulator [Rhodospirillaceae bacterium]
MRDGDLHSFNQPPLFSQIDDAAMERIFAGTSAVDYAKGQAIFHRGDPADVFYFVADGWVKVYRSTAEGDEAIVHIFSAGDTIAEAVAFAGKNYPVSAQAVENSRVVPILTKRLVAELSHSPELALSIMGSLSQQLHSMVVEIEQLKTRTATQRVCDFFIRRCAVEEGPAVISLPYDKVIIASRLGMKPESLSRILNRLRKVGVRTENGRVAVSDVAALIRFSEGESPSSLRASS